MSRDRFAKIITLNHEASQTLASFWLPFGTIHFIFWELSQNGGFYDRSSSIYAWPSNGGSSYGSCWHFVVEVTGIVGREAAKAHQRGGIKFKWLNQQLVGGGK